MNIRPTLKGILNWSKGPSTKRFCLRSCWLIFKIINLGPSLNFSVGRQFPVEKFFIYELFTQSQCAVLKVLSQRISWGRAEYKVKKWQSYSHCTCVCGKVCVCVCVCACVPYALMLYVWGTHCGNCRRNEWPNCFSPTPLCAKHKSSFIHRILSGQHQSQSWALSVFLKYFINKKWSCCIFYQVNLFLHQSYLKIPNPVKLTW